MEALVSCGRVKVESDLVFSLEAFVVSRNRPASEQDWLAQCLVHLLKAALEQAPPEDAERWKEVLRGRIRHEARELYGNVDVRSWPFILKLVGADATLMDGEVLAAQVRLQLCTAGGAGAHQRWYEGLQEAVKLIAELRRADCLGAQALYELFNDKAHFDRRRRQALLSTVLRGAPREVTRELLQRIDGEEVETEERHDEELALLFGLIQQLGEDVRCCKHAFFKMKENWISGLVFGQELTPDQVCDHIEDEDNHEEFLKTAVNTCCRNGRRFEAARMLARPASKATKCFATNRNDRELSYLMSLYKDVRPIVDQFAPVEDSALLLPTPSCDVLYVEDAGHRLERLEGELLDGSRPMAVGVWWIWRCFNPSLDMWPRASVLAMAYEGKLAIVDFIRLESGSEVAQERSKEVVRRILEAPHLLKVVHGLSAASLRALQLAAMPSSELWQGGGLDLPVLEPVLDVAMAAAYARGTRPAAKSAAELCGLSFTYLRLELCLAEALSNWERRPLRLSQQHYALTLAWCPLMILRAMCAYDILRLEEVGLLPMRVGQSGTPKQLEEAMSCLTFAVDSTAEAEVEVKSAAYAQNLLEDPGFLGALAPAQRLGPQAVGEALAQLGSLRLPREAATQIQPALAMLFDRAAARHDLDRLYVAYHEHQRQSPSAAATAGAP